MSCSRLCLGALCAALAFAAIDMSPAAALPPSFEADLDARIASNDIDGLMGLFKQITTPADEKQAIELMKSRAGAGRGFDGMSFLIAKAYRETGDAKSATFWVNYGRALLLVDARKCTDHTAIDQKFRNTWETFRDLDRVLQSWAQAERNDMFDRVVALEEGTFARRQPDKWLCSGGVLDFARREMDAGRAPKDPRYYQLYTDSATWRRLNDEEIKGLRKTLEAAADTNSRRP